MKKKEIITTLAVVSTIVSTAAAHHSTPDYSSAQNPNNNNSIKDVTLLAAQNTNKIGQVANTSFLHFRSGPSTDSSIIRILSANQQMTILGESDGWYKVNISGTIGYVYAQYVSIVDTNAKETANLVNTTFLHLRSSASIYSDIIETLNSNDTLTILSKEGSWYKVEVNGQTGYVYGYYLEINNSSDSCNNNQSSSPTTTPDSTSNQSTSTTTGIGVGHLINTSFLHFRDEPTVDSNIIETLYNNNDIIVLSAENQGWYEVEVNGQTGYVDGNYLEVSPNSSPNTPSSCAPVQKPINSNTNNNFIGTGHLTNTTFLHFRNEATLYSNIIFTLNTNSNINVIKKVGSWYEIEVNGQTGYVYAYYLSVVSNSSSNNGNNSNSNNNSTSNSGSSISSDSNSPSENIIGTASLINTTFLHFRSQPNTNSDVIKTIYSNDTINILSKAGSWYEAEVNGQIGYLYGYYLNINSNENSNSSSSSNSSNSITGEVVNSPFLHVRAGAGTNFSILEDIYLYNKVQVLQKLGSWYEIKVNGKIGYVYSYYLDIVSGSLSGDSSSSPTNNTDSNNDNIEKGTVVNLQTLNVRSSPSTNCSVLGTLSNGAYVNIISSDNGWYKIEYDGSYAYVSANYIQIVSPYQNDTANDSNNISSLSATGFINGYLVNIRSSANSNSKVIGQETINSPVTITGEKNNFYRVKLGNTYGFIAKKYITISQTSDSNTDQNNNANNSSNNTTDNNSIDNNTNTSITNKVTTNYPISLNDYINIEYNNWPLFSKQEFMNAINPDQIDNMYQFLSINQFRSVSLSGMNNLLSGKGVLSGQGQAFINACKQYNIDPVYFVNQSILETGYGQSRLAKGVTISEIAIQSEPIYNSQGQLVGYQMQKLPKPVTVYNLFGIGAQDNSSVFNNRALILGTTYAYTHGWTSICASIAGAADFVSSAYIHNNYYEQNTVYKLRFSPQISSIWHQYCTNIWYAKDLANLMRQNSNLYLGGDTFTYDVPTFKS